LITGGVAAAREEVGGSHLDGVLFGFAQFFGLSAFLRSKANFR
jgi:hypothetical protein